MSKAKGSTFERQLCKDLSLWVSRGSRDDLYWRSAMSGGRATVAKKKGINLAHVSGDICAVHPEGAVLTDFFFIEAKHYKDLHFTGFLLSGVGPIAVFWKKAQEQAKQHGKIPMLILKQNAYPVVVLLPLGSAVCIGLENRVFPIANLYISRASMYGWLALLSTSFPLRKRITT